jgi:molecular chaperone DnaK
MVREAASHAAEDQMRKDQIEERNQAEQLMYTSERSLKDLGDKVAATDKTDAEQAIKGVKEALEASDPARLRSAAESLRGVMARITQAAYEQAGAAGAPTGGGPTQEEGGGGGDEVIDAEFRESE